MLWPTSDMQVMIMMMTMMIILIVTMILMVTMVMLMVMVDGAVDRRAVKSRALFNQATTSTTNYQAH